MGSSTLGLIVEFFLHNYKNVVIKHVIENNHIIFCTWYIE